MLRKILACSVCCEIIVIALFICCCLKDKLGPISMNCHIHEMVGNLKVELYLLGKLKFNFNSMSCQATEGSAVK